MLIPGEYTCFTPFSSKLSGFIFLFIFSHIQTFYFTVRSYITAEGVILN